MNGPRVVLADNAGPFALGGTRTFLVGRHQVAVIDPGPADRPHLERLAGEVAGFEGTILLTHAHPDHAGGARALADATHLPLRAHPSFGALPLEDGSLVDTDAGALRALATPGHSADHLAFFHEAVGDLYVGDLLIGEGSTTWVGEYSGCVADYLASLDRIEGVRARRIFPAHGGPLDDPGEAIRRFREHRLRRIEEVRAVAEVLGSHRLRDSEGVEEVVDRIYGTGLPAPLRLGALWSVRAILEYLEVAPFPEEGAPTGY